MARHRHGGLSHLHGNDRNRCSSHADFKLKDWQTMIAACIIAACIALVGGSMAYRGAAKVELDREAAAVALQRKRLHSF
ncbi:hypothetical protein WI604_15845 [Bradyrhizobium symbiodeficiens]|uniref:hypothetical protein n=1 Tax=Bradyrhizobium symbiodeficiens TaxID=1404367 RepID=UPI0030CEAA09